MSVAVIPAEFRESPAGQPTQRWPAPLIVLAAIGLLAALLPTAAMWLRLLTYPYDWDPGEWMNVYYASLLGQGHSPYGNFNEYPMTGDCYPPVYHLTLVPLVMVFGRSVIVGRVVSWLATLATAVAVGSLSRELTGSRRAMWIAA